MGEAKTAEVLHKAGKWYFSVTVECSPDRASGNKAVGVDWGLETFATVVDSDGGNDPVRDHGLHLEQRVVRRNRLALVADLLGQLGDVLHQRVTV